MSCPATIISKPGCMSMSRRRALGREKRSPLFRSAIGRSGKLSDRVLAMSHGPNTLDLNSLPPEARAVERNALDLVQRKARQAGVTTAICNHTFRATGITAYMENGGTRLARRRHRRSPRMKARGRPSSMIAQQIRSRSMRIERIVI